MNEIVEKKERLIRKWFAKWHGGDARFWDYTVSLRTLVIRVTSPNLPGNLHIVCIDTDYLAGPVGWKNCQFQLVRREIGTTDFQYEVKDDEAGVIVRCGLIEVKENVKPVF